MGTAGDCGSHYTVKGRRAEMPEEKLTRKERKEALITAALNRLDTPWKYQEFVCPCCSGIASVIDQEEIIKAECHACSVKVVKKK